MYCEYKVKGGTVCGFVEGMQPADETPKKAVIADEKVKDEKASEEKPKAAKTSQKRKKSGK